MIAREAEKLNGKNEKDIYAQMGAVHT